MANTQTLQVHPGKGLGFLTLGSSLHNALTRLKAQPLIYPQLDLAYSPDAPVLQPVVLTLPANGLRLRFDGRDQRLRLIELLDFSKTILTYKNNELVRRQKTSSDTSTESDSPPSGPPFRHIYNRLFGPTYRGEYLPPAANSLSDSGTYVLSYPGVAFSFLVRDSAWSDQADFVAMLSSSAASAAVSMAIFHGSSWPEARANLFTIKPALPRFIGLSGRDMEHLPDEIEQVNVHGGGKLELVRRSSPPFYINLSETTPQDLVTELGPPDAIYRKNDHRISIHGTHVDDPTGTNRASETPGTRARSRESRNSSSHSAVADSDSEGAASEAEDRTLVNPECFYNYFHHGFDALVSFPAPKSPPFPGEEAEASTSKLRSQLVVTKLIMHGNVPGTYPFNRHRRCRWSIVLGGREEMWLTSEMPFTELSENLKDVWRGSYANAEEEKALQRGMVLNRDWDESPESSVELLGDLDDDLRMKKQTTSRGSASAQGLGNTELFGFPGLVLEVLKNGTVSCLTVY